MHFRVGEIEQLPPVVANRALRPSRPGQEAHHGQRGPSSAADSPAIRESPLVGHRSWRPDGVDILVARSRGCEGSLEPIGACQGCHVVR